MDKVQKIREEVERLKSQLLRGACSSQIAMETSCKEEAYNDVLAILDSLQEEPVSIDFEKELYKAFGQVKDFTLGMRIAKWFYDMGKNSQEPVSEELEEASKEWLIPQLDKSYANYGEVKMMELTRFDGYAMLDAIEFGAKWQEKQDQSIIELAEDHAMLAGMEKMKEQMMAKAVEAKVVPADLDETQFCLSDYDEVSYITAMVKAGNLKLLDKVKLVIVKED